MENDFSAIKSLNELKNLLDSGAITQEEYDVLKRKVIFGNNPGTTSSESNNPARGGSNTYPPVIPVPPTTGTPTFTPGMNQGTQPDNFNMPPVPPMPYNAGNKDNSYAGNEPINQNSDLPPSRFSTSPMQDNVNLPYTEPVIPVRHPGEQVHPIEEEPVVVKQKDWLLTILITLGVLLLLALIGYNLFSNEESEKLTSRSGPETEEVTTPETTVPETDPTVTESTRSDRIEGMVAPGVTTDAPTTPDPAIANPEPSVSSAAPAISGEEITSRVRDRLDSYYDDIKSAPFSAQRHFAPNVERYYTLINTTPNAINDNINSYHFDEFQNSESTIEEGSMKLENSGPSGFEVTYLENGKAFRKSKNQRQETKAKVRAKFDSNFKMTYFRQEQLLENKFSDE